MLIHAAEQQGVVLQPLRLCCREIELAPAIVLGFAALTRAQAKYAARKLGQLLYS